MPTIQSRSAIVYVEKQGNKFEGQTKATSMRKWLIGQIGKYSKEQDLQTELILRGCLNAYNKFHPETNINQEVNSWKGKSSLEIIKDIDKITIIKFMKKDKLSEPQEVRTEIYKNEIQVIINILNNFEVGEEVKTKVIAMAYSNRLNLGHSKWKEFFADRSQHNKLTLLLGALSEMGFITYIGGITKRLNNKISLQEVLL